MVLKKAVPNKGRYLHPANAEAGASLAARPTPSASDDQDHQFPLHQHVETLLAALPSQPRGIERELAILASLTNNVPSELRSGDLRRAIAGLRFCVRLQGLRTLCGKSQCRGFAAHRRFEFPYRGTPQALFDCFRQRAIELLYFFHFCRVKGTFQVLQLTNGCEVYVNYHTETLSLTVTEVTCSLTALAISERQLVP